jgi:hypothetical protein
MTTLNDPNNLGPVGLGPETEEKRKKKYSKRFKKAQKAERKVAKARRRMAKAVLAGLERWDDARDRSAEKKRDGAIKDFSKNAAKAYSKVWKETAKIPTDLAEAARELYPRRLRIFR